MESVKRRTRRYKCEICKQPRLTSREHTICEPCDAELKRTQDAEMQARASQNNHRKCRLCSGPMDASRYFSCKQCIPDHAMETEDMFDSVESIGYGDEEEVYNPGRFKPRGTLTEKQCGRCQQTKPIDEFGLYNKQNPTSYRSYCKPCYRVKTNEQYERMKARRVGAAVKGVVNE